MKERINFYVNTREHLSIGDNFSKADYMKYYDVSEYTAKVKLKSLVENKLLSLSKVGGKNIYSKLLHYQN